MPTRHKNGVRSAFEANLAEVPLLPCHLLGFGLLALRGQRFAVRFGFAPDAIDEDGLRVAGGVLIERAQRLDLDGRRVGQPVPANCVEKGAKKE